VRWLQEKWVKKLFIIFFSLLIFLIILSFGATLYLKKILTHDKIMQIVQRYSQLYLNRDVTFEKYDFNIFRGVVLNKVRVEKNTNINNSTDLEISQIDLRYDFKKLLKLKFHVNRIVVIGLDLDVDKKIIQEEVSFYKKRFSPVSGRTDEVQDDSQERSFRIRSVTLDDSRISFIQNTGAVKLFINELEYREDKNKKIKNDITIQFKNKNINVKGDILFDEKNILDWKISLPEHSRLDLNIETENFSNFKLLSKVKWKTKRFMVSALLGRAEEFLIVKSIKIDDQINQVYCNKGLINIKTLQSHFQCVSKLKNIDNKYMEPFLLTDKYIFNADLDLDLLINLDFNSLKKALFNGKVFLYNSRLRIEKDHFLFKKSSINIVDNDITVKKGIVRYKDHDFLYDLDKKQVFERSVPFYFKLRIPALTISKFITDADPLLNNKIYNIDADCILNLNNKKVIFNSITFNFLKGQSLAKGSIDFKDKDRILIEFDQNLVNADAGLLMSFYQVKDISGTVQVQSASEIYYIPGHKPELDKLKGTITSQLNFKQINDLNVNINYKLRDKKQRIYFYDSQLNYDYNRVNFWGFYDLKEKYFKLDGANNRLFLSSIKILEQKAKGDLKFDLFAEKKFEEKLFTTLKITSGNVIYQNLEFNNITADIAMSSNTFKGTMKISEFYKGSITADVIGTTDQDIKISARGSKVKMAPLSKDLFSQEISGDLTVDMELNINKSSKTGIINISADKGEISDTIFQKKISGFLSLPELQDIFYKKIVLKVNINDDLLNFDQFSILCSDQEHNINGNYDLSNKKVNWIIKMKLHEDFIKNVPNFILNSMKEKNNWYYVDIGVEGAAGEIKTSFK